MAYKLLIQSFSLLATLRPDQRGLTTEDTLMNCCLIRISEQLIAICMVSKTLINCFLMSQLLFLSHCATVQKHTSGADRTDTQAKDTCAKQKGYEDHNNNKQEKCSILQPSLHFSVLSCVQSSPPTT